MAKVQRLVDMGFEESPATYALQQTQGDVDRAVDLLVAQLNDTEGSARTSGGDAAQARRDRVAAAAEARHQRKAPPQRKNRVVKHPAQQPRSLEQRLEAYSNQLALQPKALDMLLYMLSTILNNPGVQKYREVKTTNARFKQTVGLANGAGEGMLEALGFRRTGDWLVLRGSEDPARLWLAKAALEKAQEGSTYQIAKDREAFAKAMQESMQSASREEADRRAVFQPKVPVEPELGIAGTTRITVFLGDSVLQRRFNADDVLENIVMWLGATHSSLIPAKLLDSKEWELVDRTLYPHRVVDVDADRMRTLQAAKFWPSAELLVQPAGTLDAEVRERERDANA